MRIPSSERSVELHGSRSRMQAPSLFSATLVRQGWSARRRVSFYPGLRRMKNNTSEEGGSKKKTRSDSHHAVGQPCLACRVRRRDTLPPPALPRVRYRCGGENARTATGTAVTGSWLLLPKRGLHHRGLPAPTRHTHITRFGALF